MHRILLTLLLLVFLCLNLKAQSFECSRTSYAISEVDNSFNRVYIGSGFLVHEPISILPIELDALAFQRSTGLVIGIGRQDKRLYFIDSNGILSAPQDIPLDPGRNYLAGEMNRQGIYYLMSSQDSVTQQLLAIDLNTMSIEEYAIPAGHFFTDIAITPHENMLYGYNLLDNRIVRMTLTATNFFALNPVEAKDDFQALYTDALDRLWGLGNIENNVASGLFQINKNNGAYSYYVTGPENYLSDVTACPFGVIIEQRNNPVIALPCTEIQSKIYIGNGGNMLSAANLEMDMPNGFDITDIQSNPFNVDDNSTNSTLRFEDMVLPRKVDSILFTFEAGDILGGDYLYQGTLSNLPDNIGTSLLTDNRNTRILDDPNLVTINTFAEDSIFEERFICLGETLVLDPSIYTSTGQWKNGPNQLKYEVDASGVYIFEAISDCFSFVIRYNVVVASCPFTIAVDHSIRPNETLPCSEVVFEYIFINDSGVPQPDLQFFDTIPEGFSILDVIKNPFENSWNEALAPEILHLEGFDLINDFDTLQVLVEVGDIDPALLGNRARLTGLPPEIGAFRESDDPDTQLIDSTFILIKGTVSDSSIITIPLCEGEALVLNGTPYGEDFLWFNGSVDSSVVVGEKGLYELIVFSGCEESYVFFDVVDALDIDVTMDSVLYQLFLSDSLFLEPLILNEGDSLNFSWNDPQDTTLYSPQNLQTWARPLRDITYQINVNNEECQDSFQFGVIVDNTRRVYVGNAFSPNGDGANDMLYLQTPEWVQVIYFEVYDRWGNRVFRIDNPKENNPEDGWNGKFKSKSLNPGAYIWNARITFLDGLTENLSGTVLLMR